jgi:hypothetical protein
MADSARKTVPAWRGDWHRRIAERIGERGYDDFLAYLRGNAGVSYSELARELADVDDIAPVQLETLHAEQVETEQRQAAILDSLTRFLRGALTKGWGVGPYWESRVIGALSSWSVTWGGGPQLKKIKKALFSVPPPKGWTPDPERDPLLEKIFEVTA